MSDRPTVPAPPPRPAPGLRLWLMAMTDDRLDAHPLPASGRVTLGRDAGCDVVVDHESVSRTHAALVIGPTVTVEDLGSANGTHVAGVRLARGVPTAVRSGELFHAGTVGLVVQHAAAPADEPAGDPIAADPRSRELHAALARFADGDISVLLLGETGSGKEMGAELIHRQSPRRERPLVKLNCAALTESLLESELFGHERGAFSGAVATKPGLLETADGGTVFLDEVGELPPAIQVKLLRALEERAVRRVGGLATRAIDVRFVAATNRNLEAMIETGDFRADLYYRLAGVTVAVPPLRERPGDLEPLVAALVGAACRRARRPALAVSPAALAVLRAYPFPGNVRELRNVLERAVLLAHGLTIEVEHLPEKLVQHRPAPSTPMSSTPTAAVPPAAGWWQPDAAASERARIIAALEAAGGNQSKAAELLGIARRTLLKRLDELGLPRPRKGRT